MKKLIAALLLLATGLAHAGIFMAEDDEPVVDPDGIFMAED